MYNTSTVCWWGVTCFVLWNTHVLICENGLRNSWSCRWVCILMAKRGQWSMSSSVALLLLEGVWMELAYGYWFWQSSWALRGEAAWYEWCSWVWTSLYCIVLDVEVWSHVTNYGHIYTTQHLVGLNEVWAYLAHCKLRLYIFIFIFIYQSLLYMASITSSQCITRSIHIWLKA